MKPIVSFSGLDGSGKSSLANHAKELFLKEGVPVKLIHLQNPSKNSSDSFDKKSNQFILFCIGLKDILLYGIKILTAGKHVIIFDRYSFDTIVKLKYRGLHNSVLLHLLRTLFPKARLSFIVYARPEITHERDNDHTLAYHEKKYQLYNEVKTDSAHNSTYSIKNEGSIEEARKRIADKIKNHFL